MKKGKLLKISLLSASLLVACAPAINANIPAMAEAFPTIPLPMVEMLTTISSMFLMISVLTSSFIAKRLGYKQTIVLGLIIVAISGIIPAFVQNFYIILISRAMLGFGIGLFNSLLVSMISYFYDGKERTSLFGVQSACEGLGGMSITFIAGQLLKINWQAPFYAYLIAVPVTMLFIAFVPRVNTKKLLEKNIVLKQNNNVNQGSYRPIIGYTCLMFIISILYMTMGIKVSTLMTSQGYASASDASLVIIFLSLGSMISGVLFGKIFEKIEQYTMTFGLIVLGFSMFLIGYASSAVIVIASGFMIGFAYRMVFPYLINKINKTPVSSSSLAMSIFLAGTNLGSFLAPYGAIVLQNISGNQSLRNLFYVDGIGFIILAIGSLLIMLFKRKSIKPLIE